MSKLKVTWDNCLAGQDRAGTGVYASRLLDQFSNRPDLEMTVLNGWRHPGRGTLIGSAVRTIQDLVWTHARLPAILRKNGADLLHAPAFIAPIRSPCPVVITIHDITYLLYPSHFTHWWTAYLKLVMPPAVKSAAAIICGSENSKRDIVHAYKIGSDKVRVVPYGVDHKRFHPGATLDTQWATALGIRHGYVLHVGTFSYRKNIPTLLHAISHLRTKGKWAGHQLVLAGSHNLSMKGGDKVLETIRELDLADSVVLTGHIPDQHVAGLYAWASIVAVPSFYEGFGFPVLEAMAAGTPVVCSNTSSLPEVAGNAAMFFPPSDQHALAHCIDELLQNSGLAEQLRHKGLDQACQFTWERTAEATAQIYREVANP